MPRSSSKVGNCHICGAYGALSFEHVPPESAFNDRTVVTPDTKRVFELRDLDKLPDLKGKQSQRGQGGYTLCGRCNSRTGHWYGAHYAAWVYQGAGVLARSGGTPTQLAYPYHLLPLRVIKQIACMFFSINGVRFRERLLQTGFTQEELSTLSRAVPNLFPRYKDWMPPMERAPNGQLFEAPWFAELDAKLQPVVHAAGKLREVGYY